jgi:hypothetical protein
MTILFIACVPVEKSIKEEMKKTLPSEIRIQTLKWVEVSVHESKYKYAPAIFKFIPSGAVKIKWRAMESSGQFFISIRPGESKVLTDAYFKRLN